jgi:hypothetical protein
MYIQKKKYDAGHVRERLPPPEYTELLLHTVQQFHFSLHAPKHPEQDSPRYPLILHY